MDIPRNTIPNTNHYSDKLGDFIETFSLELSDNYGTITPNRMKLVTSSDTQADLEIPVAITFYNGSYRVITDDFVYEGGNEMNDAFTKDTSTNAPTTEPVETLSDAELFNGSLYVSGDNEIMKLNGNTWSTPITTQLTGARPHLMTSLGQSGNARLYVTDDYDQIHSVNTSDVISATGTATFDFALGGGWSITMLEAGIDSIWVGFADSESGRGYMYEWDGSTENVYSRRIPLNAGVAAGCIVDGVPYIMDIRGRLLRFAGYTFIEVDKLPFDVPYLMDGARDQTNLRFIHPNGMTSTDRNTILFNISNQTEASSTYQDKAPSGIYEYDPQIGLYHKLSYSTSPAGATITTDKGQHRIANAGAIYFSRSTDPSSTTNGTILAGAGYLSDPSTTKYGLFINDTLKTTQGFGYFVTPKIFAKDVQDTWQKIYSIYDEILNESDKIVVKYRTREKNSLSVSANWVDSTTFTTTTDVSNFEKGDEVTVLEGTGGGQIMTIKNITSSASTWTVEVETNPHSSSGAFSALFQNFKELGQATNKNNEQFQEHTITKKNTSPWVQFKVIVELTKTSLHKLKLVSSENIK